MAELARGATPLQPEYRILRRAQPYDLATPGTPAGILAVARAAAEGGLWSYTAHFALAQLVVPPKDGGDGVAASLSLRLAADLPERPRRAWVMYVRRVQPDTGRSAWGPPPGGSSAALLDAGAERPVRPVGIEELKATLRGEVWTPPAPRTTWTVPCPQCGGTVRLTAAGKLFASHRCDSKKVEGRS